MASTDVLDTDKFVADAVIFLTRNRENDTVFNRDAITRYFYLELQTGKLTVDQSAELLERTLNSFPEFKLGEDESGESLLRAAESRSLLESAVWEGELRRQGF